jgi:hypothetical protein
MNTYDQRTGDGKFLEKALAIFREAVKRTEAERSAEPHKSMRSDRGTDSAGLRPDNCQR